MELLASINAYEMQYLIIIDEVPWFSVIERRCKFQNLSLNYSLKN